MATQNKGMETPAHGADVDTWDVPVNANTATLDAALGGQALINVTSVGTGPTALTLAQYQNMSILFSGVLSNNVNYQLPANVQGQWVVVNGTTGAHTLTISSATGAGTTVTVGQGLTRSIYCDGTNVDVADHQIADGLTLAADKGIYATSASAFATYDLPAAARTFSAATTQAAQQTALGLGTAAVKNTVSAITGSSNVPLDSAVKTYVNGPAFSAYPIGGQVFPINTFTLMIFGATEFDTASAFDTSLNHWWFKPAVAGYYQINALAYGAQTSGEWQIALYKNGAIYKEGTYSPVTNGANTSQVSSMVYLNGSTDYLQIYGYSQGTTLTSGSHSYSVYFNGALIRNA